MNKNINQVTRRGLPGIAAPDLVEDVESRRVLQSLIFNIQWILDNWPASADVVKSAPAASGGGGTTYTFAKSVLLTGTEVTLVNDAVAPGNSKYYGTDSSGVKGFHTASSTPAGGDKYMVLQKASGDDGDVVWDWVRAH